MGKYILVINRFFDASHQLPDTDDLITKGCARLHGHTYLARVEVSGANKRHGMVIDFKGIKNVVDLLDHQHINDIFKETGFTFPATSENIARFIYQTIKVKYPDLNLVSVGIIEGFKGQDNSSMSYYYGETD